MMNAGIISLKKGENMLYEAREKAEQMASSGSIVYTRRKAGML